MPDTNQPPAEPSSTAPTSLPKKKLGSSAPSGQRTPSATHTSHWVLQGKGGVGKSFCASLIGQYLSDQDRLEGCFDTDPVNRSFQSITALRVKPVEILSGSAINAKGIDRLIETVISARKDLVIDNGSACFLPLSRYLIENDIASLLREHGTSMTIHTVVTGGGNGFDTLLGLQALVRQFTPAAEIVVWVNEFFGPARFDGNDFEDTGIFSENRDRIAGIVYLRKLDPEMFAPNLAEMLERRLTFAEAAASTDFMLMEKSRLFRIKSDIWSQLGQIV